MAEMRSAKPSLALFVRCHHPETRTTTSTDSKGNRTTTRRTVDVTTYQETVPLRYAGCTDSTADIGETGPCVLLKLESRWSYVFGDGNFKQDLEKKRTQLVALNCALLLKERLSPVVPRI